jgi:bifunctional UDP-N-acetylglucosamine pyrophosphorylase/glucosamine-1-phosphate N-acetyltransferase
VIVPVYAIILAAGEGTRMRSARPKPLHLICGRPLVMHVVHSLSAVRPEQIAMVVGHGAERVTRRVLDDAPEWARMLFAEQAVQRGTGDAALVGLHALDENSDALDEKSNVSSSRPNIDDTSTVLVLTGDTPLLRPETIEELVTQHESKGYGATVLVADLADSPGGATGYGRIVRDPKSKRVLRIVEQRDATADERAITEINTGIFAFRRDLLGPALRHLSPNNSQSEYYLTDVIASLAGMGHQVGAVTADPAETLGVNDRWQLALAERELRSRINRHWLLNGVTMLDPRQTFIDTGVSIGRDVTLFPGTMLQGRTSIGAGSEIGPNTRLVDSVVGERTVVENTVAREAEIGDDCHVGPFAHLAPGSRVAEGATTGPFYSSL